MLDKLFFFLPDAVPMLVAIVGIILSYKQPKPEKHLRTTLILIAAGLIGTGLLSWARKRSDEKQHGDLVSFQKEQDTRYDQIKSQFDNVSGQLKSIANFTEHPPSSLTPQQVVSSVRSMAGARLQEGSDPYGQYNKQEFIALGQQLLAKIKPYRDEIKSYSLSSGAQMSDAPNRMQYKEFMFTYFDDVARYRKEALRRLGSSGNSMAQRMFDMQKTDNGRPNDIEDIYQDLDSLVGQLSGKAKAKWSLE